MLLPSHYYATCLGSAYSRRSSTIWKLCRNTLRCRNAAAAGQSWIEMLEIVVGERPGAVEKRVDHHALAVTGTARGSGLPDFCKVSR